MHQLMGVCLPDVICLRHFLILFAIKMGKKTNGQIKVVEDRELKSREMWKEMKVGLRKLLEGKDEWFEYDTEVMNNKWFNDARGTP